MARPDLAPGMPRLITLAAVAIVTLALYLGKDVLMPLALGILFSFLLAPLVTRLERTGLGRIPAVALVTVLSFAVIGSATFFVVKQLIDLTASLPAYRENIRQRIEAVRGHRGPISEAARSIQVLSKEVVPSPPATKPAPEPEPARTPATALPQPSPEPVPVTVVSSQSSPFTEVRDALGWVIGPLSTAAIVIVFVVFFLIGREDLRDRIIFLMGRGRIHLTTRALDDAAQRISRYLLMQLIINVSYGVPVAVVLYLLGLPNALVWGLLATALRYLPYIGPWVSASLPILLSLAVFPDWWRPLAVITLFIVLEIISNNVMEPWLYGSSTGLSSVAVIVSAVFWTWLWGPVGLLLATPLTVCLVVMGKYVGQLEFLSVLMGDEPVWDPSNRFYQRLLAMDEEEAGDVIEDYLASHSLIAVDDDIILPAMHLAERDRHRGHLSPDREDFLRQAIDTFLEELEESTAPLEAPIPPAPGQPPAGNGKTAADAGNKTGVAQAPAPVASPEPPANPPSVFCLPARDEADEVAARMFASVLRRAGYPATASSAESLASEVLEQVEQAQAPIVCISALPPAAIADSRYLCKRLRTRCDKLKLLVGLWSATGDLDRARQRLTCSGSDTVVRSFREALNEIRRFNVPHRGNNRADRAG